MIYSRICGIFFTVNSTNNNLSLINPKKKAKKSSYKDSGKLVVTACRVHEEPTFLDYIRCVEKGGGGSLFSNITFVRS